VLGKGLAGMLRLGGLSIVDAGCGLAGKVSHEQACTVRLVGRFGGAMLVKMCYDGQGLAMAGRVGVNRHSWACRI
jgi:cystathionine beta-lyase family protein involved in aluminum resistance